MDPERADANHEMDLPDWAERAKPIYHPRKWPLRLHYAVSVVLLVGGIALLATSISSIRHYVSTFQKLGEGLNPNNPQPKDLDYVQILQWASHIAVAAISASLGLGAMLLSWIGCTAAETGTCSHFCKLTLITVQLLAIVALSVTAVSLRRFAFAASLLAEDAGDAGGAFDADWWARLVDSAPAVACSVQTALHCAGWETGDCVECYGAQGGGSCDLEVCPRKCEGVSGQWAGCKASAIQGIVNNVERPVAAINFTLVGVLVVDLVLMVMLLPCFGRNEEGYFMVHAKRGRRLPRFRDQ